MRKGLSIGSRFPWAKTLFPDLSDKFSKARKNIEPPFLLPSPLFTTNMFPSQSTLKKNFFIPSPAADAAPAPSGANLYARFAFAGAVCCAITHGAMTPVDVVKTRMQLSPEVYNKVKR